MNVAKEIDFVKLPLTQGRVARIYASDFERVNQWSWRYHKDGPRRSEGSGSTVQLHNELMGVQPGQHVKFKNGDKLDCRRCNLEIVSSSGLRGIYWHRQADKWCVNLYANGKQHYCGLFDDLRDAKAMRDQKLRELGEDHRSVRRSDNRPFRRHSRSGIRGVTYDKRTRKWEVRISVNRKQKYVGRFKDPLDAAAAYDAAAIKYHGRDAVLNNLTHLRDDQLKRLEDAKNRSKPQ